ncbi:MAG: hypothetical protein JOZ69_19825, partial [Myxococcales bacterium]|nr:hypothetical protein [Myxococcales bacterium]
AGITVARGAFTDNSGTRNEVSPVAWRLELAISWDADARTAPATPATELAASSAAR